MKNFAISSETQVSHSLSKTILNSNFIKFSMGEHVFLPLEPELKFEDLIALK